ncbi:MAG: ATP synthase F1 subunit delta [Aaplasma endosymbiont of Hyalomma asiaticum]
MSLQGGGYAVCSYARVLLDLVIKDSSDSVAGEVRALLGALEDARVHAFVASPAISVAAKVSVLRDAGAEIGISTILLNFVCVVIEDGLFADLSRILERFLALLRKKRGRMNIEIVTASHLTDTEKQRILALLREEYGEPETVTERVDPEILGGFIVRGDSFVLDASFAEQLRALCHVSKKAAFNI